MSMLDRMSMNPALTWLADMNRLYDQSEIKIPHGYRERVLAVKGMLGSDVSGLVNTVLDFAVKSASVEYTIETNNKNLTKILNKWLKDVNKSLRGRVPVGLNALGKQYFMERWKCSSNILLRTLWEDEDDFYLPTKLWFVDGEDIVVKGSKDGIRRLGEETYYLRVNNRKDNNIKLPSGEDEQIFVQRPFEMWSELTTVPYIIKKGIYKNLGLIMALVGKNEFVVNKALEYLLVHKKGSEKLAETNNPDFIYSFDDLNTASEALKNFIGRRKQENGVSIYTTNFDTEIEHLIPEYEKALKSELFSPMEKRLLAGLGLVDIVEGTASSRRESILNPKPLIGEINNGITDFKTLLTDLVQTIIEINKEKHTKYFSGKIEIKVKSTPVTNFITKDTKQLIRSLYDRGLLSKRTTVEVLGEMDFDIEVNRRAEEKKEKLDKKMEPPVIQNNGDSAVAPQQLKQDEKLQTDPNKKEKDVDEEKREDRTGPEKKNFTQSSWDQGNELLPHTPATEV